VCCVLFLVCLYICVCECLVLQNNIAGVPSSRATFGFPQYCASTCVCFACIRNASCVDTKPKKKKNVRECRSIRSGASGLPYYCAPLVCVSDVMELLAVWRHNKPKTKNQCQPKKLNRKRMAGRLGIHEGGQGA